MVHPAREYDELELLFIDGIKHALRQQYARVAKNGTIEPAEATLDAWAKDIYERHCDSQGEHSEPSPEELAQWVAEHYPAPQA